MGVGSWHLTVKHAFLMSALGFCIPILRSLHHTEPEKLTEQGRRRGREGQGLGLKNRNTCGKIRID